jgi:hypothetical protein
MTRNFALGLLAYIRQAALSLDRAPNSFVEPMQYFYNARIIPPPFAVIRRLESLSGKRYFDGINIKTIINRMTGRVVGINKEKLKVILEALHKLDALLNGRVVQTASERVVIRLLLSKAEELIRQSLGAAYSAKADNIDHLNATEGQALKEFREIAGSGWPEIEVIPG